MQPYLHYFSEVPSSIQLADAAHFEVQDLMKSSQMMITDYSSVFFDMVYMKKPVIFYQFDEENYCLVGHYTHKKYQLGDRLQIKIARANLERKQLDFVLATSEKFIETDPDKADAQNGGNRSGSSKKPKKPKELRTKPKKSGGKRSGKSKGKKH